jgi:hypothetical protein
MIVRTMQVKMGGRLTDEDAGTLLGQSRDVETEYSSNLLNDILGGTYK